MNSSRQWASKFGRSAVDFAFPCGNALYNLPANAPAWKRGALAFGAVGEAALLFAPPAKLGVSLAEKTVFQLGRSALTRNAERQMLRSASKTASVASERKVVQHSTTYAGETVAKEIAEQAAIKDFFLKATSSKKINQAESMINSWLGEGTRFIRNKAGDPTFLSKDGLRRVRFDFDRPHPHKNSHIHVDEHISNGIWKESGQIYPRDVPHN